MKTWNVLAPVVALRRAETADEAITTLRAQLTAAGFDVYDGEPGCTAFESEDTGGNSPPACPFSCHYCGEQLILTGNQGYVSLSTGGTTCVQSPNWTGHRP